MELTHLHLLKPSISPIHKPFNLSNNHHRPIKLQNKTHQIRAIMSSSPNNGFPVTSHQIHTGNRVGDVKRVTKEINVFVKINLDDKPELQCRRSISHKESASTRRHFLSSASASLAAILTINCRFAAQPVWAGDKNSKGEENDEKGIIGAVQSLLDPNEKTKSGKVLPKAYLKSAREVVKTLRESLKEDPKDNAKFRRTADAAKESIRDYLGNWRGQQKVANEESYVALEKVIRSLAGFYSKAGPSAPLPDEVKSEILLNLDKAEDFL